jgi:ubiquinone/menaquinone biosynthesis C-methylase UbiE
MGIRSFFRFLRPVVGIDNQAARDRWLEDTLLSIPANSRILDAGAGTQQYRRFSKHLNYVSQDFSQYNGQGDGAALQTKEFDYGKLDIISDIASIPEPDSSFDAIMCIEVLEHVPDPLLALREFSRLLRGGGHTNLDSAVL